jgi:hypothetical protein
MAQGGGIDLGQAVLPFGLGLVAGYFVHDTIAGMINKPAMPMPLPPAQARAGTFEDYESYYVGDNMFPEGVDTIVKHKNFDREYTRASETISNVLPSITIA